MKAQPKLGVVTLNKVSRVKRDAADVGGNGLRRSRPQRTTGIPRQARNDKLGKRRVVPAWFTEWRDSLPPGMERDTMINPLWVAESIVQEAAVYVDRKFPAIYTTWLVEKAERCYAHNKRFHRHIRGSGNAGRDWLRMFMRHWLSGILRIERPDLHARFPYSWANGQRLTGQADKTRGALRANYWGRCKWPTGVRPNPLLHRGRPMSQNN